MSAKDVDDSTVLPDASLLINEANLETGVNAHF